MIFDYDTLKLIWWGFMGLLVIGFALTDGFDMGVGALLPFLGRTDDERRVIINSIGPTWEGNQVWFITAGGAAFAAWPLVYAAAFSAFYVALMLALFALFFRPVGFDYRSKLAHPAWRSGWDWALCIGGAVPALVFGVAFGNLLQGVPFHFDADLRAYYTGTFRQLLNPFAFLAGAVSLAMLAMHGATYLQLRTVGAIRERAARAALAAALGVVALFALAGLWIWAGIDGYRIVSANPGGLLNPLAKIVEKAPGAWFANYQSHPWMMAAPAAGFGGALLVVLASARGRALIAFAGSSVAVTGIILTAGLSMFPFILPSTSQPNASLTAWDAVSSHRTLQIMFWVVAVFLPLVTAYTGWVYHVLRGPVTPERVRQGGHTSY
ncbi:MAG: cytochrome d ubiquinol oxidase subunit II [Pseudomonadota bacterium]|jgi:cytochrome d ubiquinol oxidase subunit II